MSILSGARLPLENIQSSFYPLDYQEHFGAIVGDVQVRTYSGVSTPWESIPWSNVAPEDIAMWFPSASSTAVGSTLLFEIDPEQFVVAGLLIEVAAFSAAQECVVSTDVAEDHMYVDRLIPLGKYTLYDVSGTFSGSGFEYAVRTADPSVEDYTGGWLAWSDANVEADLAAVGASDKMLHIRGQSVGTGELRFKIQDLASPAVNVAREYNGVYLQEVNNDFSPYLQGDAQTFVNQFNRVEGFVPDLTRTYLFVQVCNIPPSINSSICNRWTQSFPTPVNFASNYNSVGWYQNITANSDNYRIFPPIDNTIKFGRSCLIAILDTSSPTSTVYYNGKKEIRNAVKGSNAGGAPGIDGSTTQPVTSNNSWGIGSSIAPAPGGYFNGILKTLQVIDVTGLNITDAMAYQIYNAGSARNSLPAASFILDVDFNATPLVDRSPNGYPITTFNGLVQNPWF